ncbi:pilus assembly protein CpaD [Rhizobium sp. PP-WC-2G-219]|nr:pilus assembly protein CpaD [Rhizobium sp. PP-WC-2G-219]
MTSVSALPQPERRSAMPFSSRIGPSRIARIALLSLCIAASLAACAKRDDLSTGGIPDDYRSRHPIIVGESERAIDIPIASSDRRLPVGTREVIKGFAQTYRGSANGVVQIMLPSGSRNGAAVEAVRRDIRAILVQTGVPANRLLETRYDAAGSGDAAPVRLSFTAITASTGPCGSWPEDLVSNTTENRNWSNFGCASQSNLAAQIANPTDLLGPQAQSPIDAARRGQVIDDYRGINSTPDTTISITTN